MSRRWHRKKVRGRKNNGERREERERERERHTRQTYTHTQFAVGGQPMKVWPHFNDINFIDLPNVFPSSRRRVLKAIIN